MTPKTRSDDLGSLSPRAKAWVERIAMEGGISHEDLKQKIIDGKIKPIYCMNVGPKTAAEISKWIAKPTH
jgi:hypothetical protein